MSKYFGMGLLYFRIGKLHIGFYSQKLTPLEQVRLEQREININLEERVEDLGIQVQHAKGTVQVSDIRQMPYQSTKEDQDACLHLLIESHDKKFPRQYTLQMFEAYKQIDEKFPEQNYGKIIFNKTMEEFTAGRISLDEAYFVTKYFQILATVDKKAHRFDFRDFLKPEYSFKNKEKLLKIAKEKIMAKRELAEKLSPVEKQVLKRRDSKHNCSWQVYESHLDEIKKNPPEDMALFHDIHNLIEEEVKAVQRLNELENRQGINLADYLPPTDFTLL